MGVLIKVHKDAGDVRCIVWGPAGFLNFNYSKHADFIIEAGGSFFEWGSPRNHQLVVKGQWHDIKAVHDLRAVLCCPDGSVRIEKKGGPLMEFVDNVVEHTPLGLIKAVDRKVNGDDKAAARAAARGTKGTAAALVAAGAVAVVGPGALALVAAPGAGTGAAAGMVGAAAGIVAQHGVEHATGVDSGAPSNAKDILIEVAAGGAGGAAGQTAGQLAEKQGGDALAKFVNKTVYNGAVKGSVDKTGKKVLS